MTNTNCIFQISDYDQNTINIIYINCIFQINDYDQNEVNMTNINHI